MAEIQRVERLPQLVNSGPLESSALDEHGQRAADMIISMPSIVFFHAPDDATACVIQTGASQPERYVLSETLAELESFLTGRPYDDINDDERHLAIVSRLGIMIESYVATLTDTLRDALASAGAEALEAASERWPITAELAALARSAVSADARLYVRFFAGP